MVFLWNTIKGSILATVQPAGQRQLCPELIRGVLRGEREERAVGLERGHRARVPGPDRMGHTNDKYMVYIWIIYR